MKIRLRQAIPHHLFIQSCPKQALGLNVFCFHLTQNNGQHMMTKMIVHMCLHCCLIMHSLDVIKHHPISFQISFYHFSRQFHPTSKTMCGHFEQEIRSIK
jgi:hypothetical protein